MITLAFLQNQWFRDPARVARLINRTPHDKTKFRRKLIQYALFAGCLTGRRIKKAFGAHTDLIVWEEASKEIASKASGSFPPDYAHIGTTITEFNPDVIITFGNIATNAVKKLWTGKMIVGPHPAARGSHINGELNRMALEFRNLLPHNIVDECIKDRISSQV